MDRFLPEPPSFASFFFPLQINFLYFQFCFARWGPIISIIIGIVIMVYRLYDHLHLHHVVSMVIVVFSIITTRSYFVTGDCAP